MCTTEKILAEMDQVALKQNWFPTFGFHQTEFSLSKCYRDMRNQKHWISAFQKETGEWVIEYPFDTIRECGVGARESGGI